ncbi:MAG: CHAT domain-containing protein [Caldilineaceae bacterium]
MPCSYCASSGYIRSGDNEYVVSVEGTNADEVQRVASALLETANIKLNRKETENINILIIFANPKDIEPLRLSTEDKAIRESIKFSQYRDNIQVNVLHAATIHDVRRALLESSYKIIHFSGHGAGDGLVFENESGKPHIVMPNALADFLAAYSPPIECVILNACYTKSQGQLLASSIPYTIATESPISNSGAIEFTRGFYDAIGAGKTIEFAYQEGCRTMRLTGHQTSDIPLLFSSFTKE